MNKIIHRFQLILFFCIVFLSTLSEVMGQTSLKPAGDTALNKYGLLVIESIAVLNKAAAADINLQMTDLKKKIPSLILDLRYATTNNFMHQKLYPSITTTWLRKPAADSLAVIQQQLKALGLGLKIFDAYRPYSVTEKMWEPVQDDRYAADPKKGSGHNRGIAVDLTLVNLKTGKDLDMGTGFDNFSDTAHHAFTQLPASVLQNRSLLKKIMEQHGFKALDTEWWHYSLPNAASFALLNISFTVLQQQKKSHHND